MPNKIVPNAVKNSVRKQFRVLLRESLPFVNGRVMQVSTFYPHRAEEDSYTLPAYPSPDKRHAASRPPLPPAELRVNYGTSDEEYLECGRKDITKMRQILQAAGSPIESAKRILEFGCAAGRMIRWLDEFAPSREIWGVDIWASAVLWCKEHLSPPFHFATTTICPHLPFEDNYFDFVYAGSIFTHVEDMTDAWFLEIRRILRPGGKFYFTINDHSTVAIFEGQRTSEELEEHHKRMGGSKNWTRYVENYLRLAPGYQAFKNHKTKMVTISRSAESTVMWDAEYLCKRQEPFYRVLSKTEKAYGYQTAILFERV